MAMDRLANFSDVVTDGRAVLGWKRNAVNERVGS